MGKPGICSVAFVLAQVPPVSALHMAKVSVQELAGDLLSDTK